MKQCSTCKYWYSVKAFDLCKRSGLQPQCHECRDKWESTPNGVFSRLMSYLDKHEPVAASEWRSCPGGAFAEFMRKWEMSSGRCSWCGAGLGEWQVSGHRMDRVDNNDGHRPQNVRLACAACNFTRGRESFYSFKERITSLIKEHGHGNVPWAAINDRFKRRQPRRTGHLKCRPPNLEFPFGGSR